MAPLVAAHDRLLAQALSPLTGTTMAARDRDDEVKAR
jgi:hypothetical protein